MRKSKPFLKMLTFLFALVLTFSSIGMKVYAKEDRSFKKQINEYQMLKNLNKEYNKAKLTGTLKNSKFENMPDETISAIANYKNIYSEKIKELKSWNTDQLKGFNYSDSQIEAIKSFDGSEEMMALAASTCDVKGDFNYFYPGYTGSRAQLIMEFYWSGVQSNWFNDIFAVAWTSPFNAVSLSGYVSYKNANYQTKTIDYTPVASGLFGSYIKFPKYKNVSGEAAYYVTSGSMIIDLKSNTYVADITGYAEYGYNSLNVSPSVDINGTLGISFGSFIEVMDSHRCYR